MPGCKNDSDKGFINKYEANNLLINNVKEGKWCEYIDSDYNSTKDTNAPYYNLTVYKRGNPIGTVRGYYKSDKLFSVAYFDTNGVDTGVSKIYYENDTLEWEIPHIKGIERKYYENGHISEETQWSKGEINGCEKDYYRNGNLKREVPWVNSKINGIEKDYYETGQIKTTTTYTNDTLNGIEKEYYLDGEVSWEIHYTKGRSDSNKPFHQEWRKSRSLW